MVNDVFYFVLVSINVKKFVRVSKQLVNRIVCYVTNPFTWETMSLDYTTSKNLFDRTMEIRLAGWVSSFTHKIPISHSLVSKST